jgi:hypothetical protein
MGLINELNLPLASSVNGTRVLSTYQLMVSDTRLKDA